MTRVRILAGAGCLSVLIAISACVTNRAQSPLRPLLKMVSGGVTTVAEFESVVNESMAKAGVSGLSVAIINGGRIAYTNQFGWKDKDAGTALDDSTMFAGASLSKTIFAYLTLRLASDGLIDLDKPLHGYLPQPLPRDSDFADLAIEPQYRLITARMVLSHTTGLPNLRATTRDGRLNIGFPPGSRFKYSGEGFRLLQLVVEALTNSDLETLAQDRVFAPLGMGHTSFIWRDRFAANAAAKHNEFEWAADPDSPPDADAAGSLLTTAHDYARFLVGLLAAERIPKGLVQMMWAPQVRITSARMFGTTNGASNPDKDRHELAWALGWGTFDTPDGRALFHTGHKAGAQNYAVIFPDRGIGIVLFSNSDNFESVAAEIVAAGIGDRESPFDWLGYKPFDPANRKSPPPRLVAIPVSSAVIAPYAGRYQLAPGAIVHVKVDSDRLYASDDGQSWDELLALSEAVFFFKGRSVTIAFVKDESGRVTLMEVDNNGTKLRAPRIQ